MSTADNKKLLLKLAIVACFMFGLAFASVPLYRAFCQVTGFGGTTQEAEDYSDIKPIDRWMTVRFNADISPKLAWKFKPDQKEMRVRVGEPALATFTAENLTDKPITGTAIYNVTPLKTGEHFVKVQCFCFDLQTLAPHQKVSMPVSFYVDPSIDTDDNLDEVKTITLSYYFLKSQDDE